MPAFVQVVATGTGTGINPLVLTLGAVTTSAANTLCLQVRVTGGKTLVSVTDSQANAWHVDQPGTTTQSGCAMASSANGTPLGPGDTITLTFSATNTPIAGVAEFSGVGETAGTPQLDGTADLINSVSGVITPELAAPVTGPGELAVSCAGGNSATATWTVTAADPDSGGTWVAIPYSVGIGAAYQLGPNSLVQYKVTWTGTTTTNCEAMISTYQQASIAKAGTDVSAAGTEGAPKTGVNDAVGFP